MESFLGVDTVVEAVTRIDAEEMTLVTVVRVFVVPVVEPLLQVAFASYLVGLQTGEGSVGLSNELAVDIEDGGCISGISQTLANHGDVGKTAVAGTTVIAVGSDEGVLGRSGGSGDEIVDG